MPRGWGAFDLTWLEDPFPARLAALVGPFRRAVDIPLALGEDRAGLDDFTALLELDIDVLRIDATVCGGITEFLRAAGVAAARGRSVSPHVFPEIHVHLAAALPERHRRRDGRPALGRDTDRPAVAAAGRAQRNGGTARRAPASGWCSTTKRCSATSCAIRSRRRSAVTVDERRRHRPPRTDRCKGRRSSSFAARPRRRLPGVRRSSSCSSP